MLRSFGFPLSVANHPPVIVSFILFQALLAPVEALFGIALNAVSRHFEWQADKYAFEQDVVESDRKVVEKEGEDSTPDASDMGSRLARALIGLHKENLSSVWVDWL